MSVGKFKAEEHTSRKLLTLKAKACSSLDVPKK